jgi:peptidoglycan/xylan/chitin deacetylase (PgdA/CDA1 family)
MQRFPILLYHHITRMSGRLDSFSVSADRFEQQMKGLAKAGWRTVGLSDWMDHHLSGKALPDRSFVLTFDDGHLNNRTEAFPVLQRFGFTATIFLAVDSIESGRDSSGSLMLGWEDAKTMRFAGFDFQSHGMSHRRLTALSEKDARDDIVRSKRILEERFGRAVDFFAYPFGDSNSAIQRMVSEAGYRAACGGVPAWGGGLFDPYAVGRTEIFQNDTPARFAVKMATGYDWRLFVRKGLGRVVKHKRRESV